MVESSEHSSLAKTIRNVSIQEGLPSKGRENNRDGLIGVHPRHEVEVHRKTGRFGPYVEMEVEGSKVRASIPKDLDKFNIDWAVRLLDLPRVVGSHPETGKEIEAAIGRYGPYLKHDGKFGKLQTTVDVLKWE